MIRDSSCKNTFGESWETLHGILKSISIGSYQTPTFVNANTSPFKLFHTKWPTFGLLHFDQFWKWFDSNRTSDRHSKVPLPTKSSNKFNECIAPSLKRVLKLCPIWAKWQRNYWFHVKTLQCFEKARSKLLCCVEWGFWCWGLLHIRILLQNNKYTWSGVALVFFQTLDFYWKPYE